MASVRLLTSPNGCHSVVLVTQKTKNRQNYLGKMISIANISVLIALVVVAAAHPIKDDSDVSIHKRVMVLNGPEIYHLENGNESTLGQHSEVSSDPRLWEQREVRKNKNETNADVSTGCFVGVKSQRVHKSLVQRFKEFFKFIKKIFTTDYLLKKFKICQKQ